MLTGILPTHIHGRHRSPMMMIPSSSGGRWRHSLLISSLLHIMIIHRTAPLRGSATHLLLLRTPMPLITVMPSHLMGGHLLRLGRTIHLG